MAGLGMLGAALHLVPARIRRPLVNALMITLIFSLFSDVPLNIANQFLARDLVRLVFAKKGIALIAAVVVFVLALAIALWWKFSGQAAPATAAGYHQPGASNNNAIDRQRAGLSLVLLLVLPRVLGHLPDQRRGPGAAHSF